jgi:ABC-2 type transport system ATP-binding protein
VTNVMEATDVVDATHVEPDAPVAPVDADIALRTESLTKRFGRSVAVAGVDLEIERGEIFGLVGPNGAGKTTTLKMLATLLPPTAGDAHIGGHSIRRDADAVRRVIGYMPDTFGVYDDMRVWEYLDFFGRCYGLPASRRRQMIGDLLELVDLADKRGAYVQELSRGMQQRLCLAHALVHDPEVLLLDEPASGLDPRARVELRELLRELRSLGKTIVISSHILPELEELCTSVAIIDHGRVLASGRVDEIAERFRVGGVYRVMVIGDDTSIASAEQHFAALNDVASVVVRPGGELELALRGDNDAAAGVLASAVRSGVRVSSFAPAASDLEELFLQITDRDKEAAA